jgi:hypothetical protein
MQLVRLRAQPGDECDAQADALRERLARRATLAPVPALRMEWCAAEAGEREMATDGDGTSDMDRQWIARGLRLVISIAEQLAITSDELGQLLVAPSSILKSWLEPAGKEDHAGFNLPLETVRRISYLLGIWRWLITLFPMSSNRQHWLRSSNRHELFGGMSPLDLMLTADRHGLHAVREHLRHAAA